MGVEIAIIGAEARGIVAGQRTQRHDRVCEPRQLRSDLFRPHDPPCERKRSSNPCIALAIAMSWVGFQSREHAPSIRESHLPRILQRLAREPRQQVRSELSDVLELPVSADSNPRIRHQGAEFLQDLLHEEMDAHDALELGSVRYLVVPVHLNEDLPGVPERIDRRLEGPLVPVIEPKRSALDGIRAGARRAWKEQHSAIDQRGSEPLGMRRAPRRVRLEYADGASARERELQEREECEAHLSCRYHSTKPGGNHRHETLRDDRRLEERSG